MKSKILFGATSLIMSIGILGVQNVEASEVAPLLTRIDWVGNTYYKNYLEQGNIKKLNYNSFNKDMFNLSGTKDGEPVKTDLEPIYLGETSEGLVNNTDVEQIMYAPSFSKAVTQTKTTTVTDGGFFTGKINIPLLGDISGNFNTSTSNAETESETITITSPPEPIKVPAGKRYGVKVSLKQVRYTGKVKLLAETWRDNETITSNVKKRYSTGNFTYYRDEDITYPIDLAYYTTPSNFAENKIKYQSNSKNYEDAKQKYANGTLKTKLTVEGAGEYTINYGTEFNIQYYDMDTKQIKSEKTVSIS
ncbi:ETX/MTX2 family pore-forming toxin [Enterococcus faecalis]|uniref:ETX/MTX2 family pore-forming toxin n=1 Tax=Enterococcus faecalis TaxID=1351 RepID=UPI000353097F|nr:ETX/MTX2 family pore-forming toxin [Enterococcus faecalis]EPI38517.1 hypothetical protein D348_00124 [Enterococcus faecalis SLO2C-1]MCH1672743.1 ETX/MTX2 family pore-forming toxin [Enterococcus faecalis]MDM3980275.1 ETX/MTX2 family pore-forming toxin [Enterococcus faecalis]NSN01536.1 ETX/MTX2 family pore-forming toxin [Enterococcus faecalis]NSN40920.1 ETX/MTX2 family pore-forming toxin [Enterococcus faecalis]